MEGARGIRKISVEQGSKPSVILYLQPNHSRKYIMGDPILWNVRFLDCCLAAPVCMLACLCPAAVQSLTLAKINKSSCLGFMFAQYCCCIGLSFNRKSIRESKKNNEKKDISGSCCMECLLYSCVCCCCHAYLATQEYREFS